MKIRHYLILTLILFIPIVGSSQVLNPAFFDYPQNHIDWMTLESEHFEIHFQKGNEQSAQIVSRIAEEIYSPITELYQFIPNTRIHIILRDRQDYANGAAYFYDNKIEIWTSALDTPLRGTRDWFRNVITHEFTHIIQVQASMKRDRKIPAWYLQWLEYEDVRRADVLYGFPTGIFTMPLLSINMPAWFSEGTAQYMRTGLNYDIWDAHRDMILRTRTLSGTTLSLTQMGNFSSNTSLENETIYNQGYAFSTWMARKYGEEILGDITRALSNKGVNRIEKAIKFATGVEGQSLFEEFIAERTAYYKSAVSAISMPAPDTLQGLGFANFNATFTANGTVVGYLTNGGSDYFRIQMKVDTLESVGEKATSTLLLDKESSLFGSGSKHNFNRNTLGNSHLGHSHTAQNDALCMESTTILNLVNDAFSFSPDGKKVAYSFNWLNKRGEFFKDLYVFDIEKDERRRLFDLEKPERLTYSARVYAPNWHPTEEKLVAIAKGDNTLNLVLYDLTANSGNEAIEQITDFLHGEQIYVPKWSPDGNHIVFAFMDGKARYIRRFSVATSEIETLVEGENSDYRDPTYSPDGQFLYYSSDETGIFNIYEVRLDEKGLPIKSSTKTLTNVLGGAFMPAVNNDNVIIWSEYIADGYKIMKSDLATLRAASPSYSFYAPKNSDNFRTSRPTEEAFTALNNFDDSDLSTFSSQVMAVADTGKYVYTLKTLAESNERILRPYEETFLKFAWYPVVRFDNYNKPKGQNGELLTNGRFGDLGYNLGRDFKFGTYFGSREVTENLSIFGGLLIAPASREATSVGNAISPTRLTELDRDFVLTAEYRGLPFIKKRWSPTLQINLFNLRRNVDNGLNIEEHPCTSCAPDTTTADIAFNIWQADINLISKLNRSNLVQLGVSFSPFRVITEGFFSREFNQFIPSSSAEYFRGTTYTAAYIYDLIVPSRHSDISPIGFRGFFRMNYQPSQLLDNYRIENGSLIPVFQRENNVSFEAFTRYGFPIKGKTTGQLFTRAFSYLNDPESLFFADYFGGITGLRSYPFFALGGNSTAFSVLSLITPIDSDMDFQLGRYHVDKIYARFFAETGAGWGADLGYNGALRTGVGAELRVNMTGQYIFPSKFFISTAYGLNGFDVNLSDEFVSDANRRNVSYGRELLFHFGFTFDFDLN
jgi:WD40 repeat protein